jgi:cation/acetate symporter
MKLVNRKTTQMGHVQLRRVPAGEVLSVSSGDSDMFGALCEVGTRAAGALVAYLVVAGLVLSASAAVSHDIWSNVIRKGKDSEHEEVWVAKIAAFSIGAIAILIAVIGGEGLNVSFMVGLAFAVAASANFPALLLALTWRRFNTTGAVSATVVGQARAVFDSTG